MRYITDIFQRFQGGFGFVGANIQGLINQGAFRAGIAYNEAKYLQKGIRQTPEYDLQLYTVNEFSFADIDLSYTSEKNETTRLNFGFGSLTEDSDFFAPPPMVSFRRSKNLGITIIDDGNEAEIVENFGLNSWDIDIRGLIIDMNEHHYPQAKIKQFARFFEINDIITVVSPLFQDLGVSSIYFKEQTIEPLEGYVDTIKFTLTAKSIKPAEFSINNLLTTS